MKAMQPTTKAASRIAGAFKALAMALALALAAPATATGAADGGSRYDYFFLEAMMQRQKGHSDAAFDLLPLREQFATEDSLNIVVHAPLYGEKETAQEVVYRLGGEETDEGESVAAITLSSLQLE